ncbi:hypothetical protein [Streptomyces sp. WMMB 322]|uniref:competence protein CoiA family protein n=1 Tax=Streptomyces sp. WMMB 322 TaxID=1286821 RepID=UPI000823BAD0|nr:hypothetical protein [Streptomyces sp. WMMB 322]SCK09503.1 hypothetical protein H180DRAFT_00471 [Streptomyces sp. WMMB 322]
MAKGVFHTGYEIEINLTRQDLGHPDRPDLLLEITQPVDQRPRDLLQCLKDREGQGRCQCALADKTPWMFIRRQRVGGKVVWTAAHLPITHTATPVESEKHKAMKERIARIASVHGLDVQTEARSADGRVVTDVLVTGAGASVGWEAQYSPISAGTVWRRSARARENQIRPLWVTADDSSAVIDRAPWARVDNVPWQRIASPLAMIIRGGVRHLQIWKCTPASERPCPRTGQACGKWHYGWFVPALCLPQERATSLDELIVTSADGEHAALRVRDSEDPKRISHLWALKSDAHRWYELHGKANTVSEADLDDEEQVTYTDEELDTSCRYGERGFYTSSPRPRRGTSAVTGLYTLDAAPDRLRLPSRPVQLRLSEQQRRTIAAELRCPPWEVGPCSLCAQPIHRYGPNSPLVCNACRTSASAS